MKIVRIMNTFGAICCLDACRSTRGNIEIFEVRITDTALDRFWVEPAFSVAELIDTLAREDGHAAHAAAMKLVERGSPRDGAVTLWGDRPSPI